MKRDPAGCGGCEGDGDQGRFACAAGEREDALAQGCAESPGCAGGEAGEGLLGASFLRYEDRGLVGFELIMSLVLVGWDGMLVNLRLCWGRRGPL